MSDKSIEEKVVYVYDGSFEGFLCCVYNFYYNRLKPIAIVPYSQFTPSLYDNIDIETDYKQVYKVRFAIEEKISYNCIEFLNDCFLTCLEEKEMYMLRFIIKGFKIGRGIINMLSDSDVSTLNKARVNIQREQRLYLGIIRFYKAEDIYVASIKPKNQVLPMLAWHFTERFANQSFIIYDETNLQALIYSGGKYKIIFTDGIELPPPDAQEVYTQKLWKKFYDTIAIKERYNPKCRMNFLPKYRWENLPEMQGEPEKETAMREIANSNKKQLL